MLSLYESALLCPSLLWRHRQIFVKNRLYQIIIPTTDDGIEKSSLCTTKYIFFIDDAMKCYFGLKEEVLVIITSFFYVCFEVIIRKYNKTGTNSLSRFQKFLRAE